MVRRRKLALSQQLDLIQPDYNCNICPRLQAFREKAKLQMPTGYNGPVPVFLPRSPLALNAVRLLIVGLAPGLKGANFSGRPFTGDYAGSLLYSTLIKFGFAKGEYLAQIDDSLELVDCAITNAVRCVPPDNKPLTSEIKNCQLFLASLLANLPNLQLIVALGRVAHCSLVSLLGYKQSALPFSHGGYYNLQPYSLLSSYHCSRYNTNTGVLTTAMFEDVFAKAQEILTR